MKRWVWFIIAGIVFLLAGGGVIYGVLTRKNTEPEFMYVCWKNGIADYNGDCQKLSWKKEQMPLTYYIDFDENHKDYIESVVDGAQMWNDWLCPILERVDKGENANITITWGAYHSDKQSCTAGFASHIGNEKGPIGASIVLKNPSDIHAVYLYAAHEFGHVLGLPHDDYSIMKPTLPDVTEKMILISPPDYAVKKLKKELCP